MLGPFLAAPQLSAQTGSISASPNPCQIAAGKRTCTTTLSWSATGASRLRVMVSHNGRTAGNFATSGSSGSQSASWIQAAPSHTYTFYLYDYSGGSLGSRLGSVTVTGKAPPKPPTISSFSFSPTTIDKGKSATLKWSTTNATSVSISPGIGTVSASGSRSVSPSKTTTYTLKATNSAKSVTATAKVTVRPPSTVSGTISASPNPCTIAAGERTCRTTLSWSATGTSGLLVRVSRNGRPSTVLASSGRSGSASPSWIQAAPANTYTFSLYNYAGRVQGKLLDSVKVTGKAPPPKPPTISSFSASPSTIDKGKSSTLRWSTANADSLSITPGIGTVTGTSLKVSPSSTTTYTLTATNSVKSVTARATVTVKVSLAPAINSFTASPTTIDKGKSSTLRWSTTNADTLSITPGKGILTDAERRLYARTGLRVSPSSTTTYTLTAANAVKSVKATRTVTVRGTPPAVSGSISASPNPCTIAVGETTCTTTLTWSATGTSGLRVRVSRNGRASTVVASSGASGSASPSWIRAAPANTYTFSLYDYAGRVQGKLLDSVTVTGKAPAQPPTISSFSISPTRVEKGKSATLRWSTSDATSVTISPGIGKVTASGSRTVSPSATTTYTLTATNAVKSVTATAKVTVGPLQPAPTVQYFITSPRSIHKGRSATLRWSTSNADGVSIDQGIGTVTARGSRTVSPTSTTTYTLTAANSTKSVEATVTVTVMPPPSPTIRYFIPVPSSIDKGRSATLVWRTTNAETLSIRPDIGPDIGKVTGRFHRVSPSSTTTYTLTASNSVKSVTATATVTVKGTKTAPTISSFTASPERIAQGERSTLRWKTSNADTLSITPGIGTLTDTQRRAYAIRPLQVSPTSTTTYTLKATNSAGSVEATATVTVGPPRVSGIISASLNPCAIEEGQHTCVSTIQWTVKNTTLVKVYVSINGRKERLFATATGDGSLAATGIMGSSNKYVFSLYDYTGDVRGTLLGSVTVTGRRVPTGTFTATPTTIDQGESATLKWSTTNADSVFISPGVGTVSAQGSSTVSPSSTTTYTLNVTNEVRSVKLKVTVTVRKTTAPMISSFTATPTTIDKGQSATLRWSTTDAETLSITPGIGTLTETQRRVYRIRPLRVSPASTTTYTLKATNRVKSVTATVTVTVRESKVSGTISVSPDPCTIYHGQTGCTPTVTWESKGATSVQVWYSLNGGEEQYLASSDGGGPYSKKLDVELKENDTIDFKLYDYSSGTRGALVEETEKSLTVQTDIGCPPASN